MIRNIVSFLTQTLKLLKTYKSNNIYDEAIILVHGMGRTKLSMVTLKSKFKNNGYTVINFGYSSYQYTITELTEHFSKAIKKVYEDVNIEKIHFVGHSLGNIIIRAYLKNYSSPKTGRVVMIAPPNQGSKTADWYSKWLWWFYKPLPELTTDKSSFVNTLGDMPEGIEFGIIAGKYDGKVSIPESHLKGEKDHIVVNSSHTFIMMNPKVQNLVLSFIKTGKFSMSGL